MLFRSREGRPTEKETLTSRLIDRPIRPLFPDGFYNEVQVVAQVLSLNPEVDADIPAMIAVSAALTLSGVPFNGPIGAARVGYLNGQYVLNPTASQIKESQLNLVVAGTSQGVLMVESEALELPEDVMLGAVVFGHEQMQAVIGLIPAAFGGASLEEWSPGGKLYVNAIERAKLALAQKPEQEDRAHHHDRGHEDVGPTREAAARGVAQPHHRRHACQRHPREGHGVRPLLQFVRIGAARFRHDRAAPRWTYVPARNFTGDRGFFQET